MSILPPPPKGTRIQDDGKGKPFVTTLWASWFDALSSAVNRLGARSIGGISTIASGSTIAPNDSLVFVSGSSAIDTITVPSFLTGSAGSITLIPTGAWTTTTAGNIAKTSTATVDRAMTFFYDSGTALWYPSY